MNKIQFFYDQDIVALQEKISHWLMENKDINIIATNLSSIGKPSLRAGVMSTEKYVFYLLYTVISNNKMTIEEHAIGEELKPVSMRHIEGNPTARAHN